jgi:hypothetical protein
MARPRLRALGRAAALGLVLTSLACAAKPAAPPKRDLDLRDDCGATGDGKADDSGALKACLQRMQALLDTGGPAVLHIRAGIYRITGANGPMPMIERHGGTILGEGPHASYIVLDPSYAGDLFSWSEAWGANVDPGETEDPTKDRTGAVLEGLGIIGSRDAAAAQNAIVFYDRDDFVLVRDVEVNSVKGRGLWIGVSRNQPVAYARESTIENLRVWQSGAPGVPAVEISAEGGAGVDATNQLDVIALSVFRSLGPGVTIRNHGQGVVRTIRFTGLRVEASAEDGLTIGDPAWAGRVRDITIRHFVAAGSARNFATVRITAPSGTSQPFLISLEGEIGTGKGIGVAVDAGRAIDVHLFNCVYVGYCLTVGSSAKVAAPILFDSFGRGASWPSSIDTSSAASMISPTYTSWPSPPTWKSPG